MGNKNYNASYKSEVVTDNKVITRGVFSCAAFQNVGETVVRVNGLIIPVGGSVEFDELPNVIINTDFEVEFEPEPGKTQLLNIVLTYYQETK